MSDEFEKYRFPQMLDQQRRLFGLQIDEAILLLAPLGVGFYFGYYVVGLASGMILMFILKKLKRGKPSTYLYNAVYWYFPSYTRGSVFKKIPPSYYRHWIK